MYSRSARRIAEEVRALETEEQTERWGALPSAAAVREAHQSEDPRDITIRTLKAEVAELARELEEAATYISERFPLSGQQTGLRAIAARALLARLACFAVIVLLALPGFAASKPRHVTRPISSITVKVMAHADYILGQKGPLAHAAWRITTVDSDSCTVWVDTTAPDVSGAEAGALRACRKAIDGAVDAAAERSGV